MKEDHNVCSPVSKLHWGPGGRGDGKAKIRRFIATAIERQQVGGGEEEEEEKKGRKLFQEAVKLLRYKTVPVATGRFTI